MNCYLNNFSLIEAENGLSINQILNDFVAVCNGLHTHSFEKIFMPHGYSDIPLSNGVSINQFIAGNTSQNTRLPIDDFITKLKSIRKNKLKSIEQDNQDEKIQYVFYENTESDFFKKANNQDVPVVSFRTKNVFDEPCLQIRIEVLNRHLEIQNSNDNVRNLSIAGHLDVHIDYLFEKAREQVVSDLNWNAMQNPFRLKERMAQYLVDQNFNEDRNSNINFRVKFFREVGTYLAEMNGWKHEREFSARFNRPIFSSSGKRKMLLSLDLQHPEFELLKYNGRHVMSYDFDGEPNGKTYDDTSHDLIF